MVPAVRPLGPLSMARGCARIDSRPDKAKIGSADRVEVHHARLLAVIGVRKTFPHGLGQNRKSSRRANVFRFAPESGHRAMQSAYPFRARSGHCDYSITSSARVSSPGGTVRPIVRAVLRLMPSCIFVAFSTGSSLHGPTMFARIVVMRALNRHIERVFDPSRKALANTIIVRPVMTFSFRRQ